MEAKVKQILGQAKEAYEAGEYERAEPLLRQVLDEGGEGFADVHHMLGQIHHDRGDFGRAQEYFETAVRINPRYTDALLALAVVYNDLGKYEDSTRIQAFARKHVEEHEGAIDPFVAGKIANMHADLASVYMEAGLPDEAIHEYDRALQLCPHFADLQTRLAHVYREMGRHDSAMFSFGQWWTRAMRAGRACAEGAYRQGGVPETNQLRRLASIVAWGGALPCATLALAPPTLGASAVLLSTYGILWTRVYRSRRLRADGRRLQ